MVSYPIIYITPVDKRYPERLRQIPDPPAGLYVLGNHPEFLCQDLLLAVVGSRQMSIYGKQVTKQLVKELVRFGYGIVSGLALGIDGVAHTTALDCLGVTIAVLGCGVDIVSPPSHAFLYQRILAQGGIIVSEVPPGCRSSRQLFAKRNRIISGLSLGVLVTEAASRSGSLITARFAAEQGRDVYAVPGSIYSVGSAGPHTLLQQGAGLVTSAEDLLRLLGSA